MTPALRKTFEHVRAALARHAGDGAVPVSLCRTWLAELEAAADQPSELAELGERTTLERNVYGFMPETRKT